MLADTEEIFEYNIQPYIDKANNKSENLHVNEFLE